MVNPQDIKSFAEKTSHSLELSTDFILTIIEEFKDSVYTGEFSNNPRSVDNLFKTVSAFKRDFEDSNYDVNYYDNHWFLPPAFACMLIHRGSLSDINYSLDKLPTYDAITSNSLKVSSPRTQRIIIALALESFIKVCKKGYNSDDLRRYPQLVEFTANLEYFAKKRDIGALYTYAGIMIYALCLAEGGLFVGHYNTRTYGIDTPLGIPSYLNQSQKTSRTNGVYQDSANVNISSDPMK